MNLSDHWYRVTSLSLLLLPIALSLQAFVWLRRRFYKLGLFRSHRLAKPVVVVGNITVGGTGKTPVVIYLAKQLQALGYKPGIILRGYQGQALIWPQRVTATSDPLLVGDEAVLHARHNPIPIVAGPSRVDDAKMILQQGECDLILCDDGLQHYALQRDIEIGVVDGKRRFGNGFTLPAGPLREPKSRLLAVDFVVLNGADQAGAFRFDLAVSSVVSIDGKTERSIASFKHQKVHAVAGIGNPERFFQSLREQEIEIIPHAFPDHHQFCEADVVFADQLPVLMTEKDAVKCRNFQRQELWYVGVEARFNTDLAAAVAGKLKSVQKMAKEWKVNDKQLAYDGYFKMEKYELEHTLYEGGWGVPIEREVMERGRVGGVLPYDPNTKEVLLIEQFRAGAIKDQAQPWLWEIIAGAIEQNESPVEMLHREAREEAGIELLEIVPVCEYLVSPGCTTEHASLFCARVDLAEAGGVFGLEDEGENILAKKYTAEEAIQMLDKGKIINGMTIIALQWFALNKNKLWGK